MATGTRREPREVKPAEQPDEKFRRESAQPDEEYRREHHFSTESPRWGSNPGTSEEERGYPREGDAKPNRS